MNNLNIGELSQEGFRIEVADIKNTVTVIFEGSIDIQEPQYVLEDYFKTVYCDFNKLQYINSSGIKCLLKWILKNYQGLDQNQKYAYIFVIDENTKWQADGIGFLKRIAPELISIQSKMP
jgi:hypothetical protein